MAETADLGVHVSAPHDSAARHVTGSALYIDDLPEPLGMLHVCLGMSERAHARIVSMDLSAVRASLGVVCVLTAADIPGKNDVSPVIPDDKLFADGEVICVGQSLFAVAAETLAREGTLDIFSSDYVPASILPAALKLANAGIGIDMAGVKAMDLVSGDDIIGGRAWLPRLYAARALALALRASPRPQAA